MKKLFLDPHQTLYTCNENSCDGCTIAHTLVCHFNGKQLTRFLLLCIPIWLIAGYIMYNFNLIIFVLWMLFTFSYFGLIEIRVMCSHCPHYAEPELKSLKCWANYGSPKLWKYRPGPMSLLEKVIFISGFLIMLLPPVVILLIQLRYLFLIIYAVLLIVLKMGLGMLYCKHCINFACPFNLVNDETRNAFFEKNQIVKHAWKK